MLADSRAEKGQSKLEDIAIIEDLWGDIKYCSGFEYSTYHEQRYSKGGIV